MNIKQITNELRSKVIEKFQSLNPLFLRNSTPEAIEGACFEKAENNAEAYVKMCQNFISNSHKQMNNDATQNNVPTMQNLRPNMTIQSNNGTNSDPINALQNLTVTAGQPNPAAMQQINVQQQIRMNANVYNQQIRQRSMMPITLQSGNIQRPMEQIQMSQSPMTQILQPQMQQHNINPINIINANNVRMYTKNVVQQSPTMTGAYQMDPNNGNQQIHNIVRPQMIRAVSNSPSMSNNINQQVSIIQTVPQEQYSVQKQNPPTPIVNVSMEDSNSQPGSNSQSTVPTVIPIVNPSVTININPNTNVASNPINTNPPNPPTAPVKVIVSEEEALMVREELLKLSVRYLKYIKLVLKNFDNINIEKNKKVWVTLAGVLEEPCASNRNISMKHVIKIQDFCEKAEKIVQSNKLEEVKPLVAPKSEEIFGKRVIPDRNRSCAVDPNTVPGASTNNVNNSLDAAFDDVVYQLKKRDPKITRMIQRNLVKFVKKQRPQCLHFLPRNLQNHDDESSDNENTKLEKNYDEHEFDFIDDVEMEEYKKRPMKGRNRVLDRNGMLRTDIDSSLLSSSEFFGLTSELDLVYGDFHVTSLEEQNWSSKWFTKDDMWEMSSFYSFTFKNDNLPTQIPPLVLRAPCDYDQEGSVDWNLNLDLYSSTDFSNNNHIFLADVRCAIENEFRNLSDQSHLSGISLLHALSVYKRSIETGYYNFECRKSMS